MHTIYFFVCNGVWVCTRGVLFVISVKLVGAYKHLFEIVKLLRL